MKVYICTSTIMLMCACQCADTMYILLCTSIHGKADPMTLYFLFFYELESSSYLISMKGLIPWPDITEFCDLTDRDSWGI